MNYYESAIASNQISTTRDRKFISQNNAIAPNQISKTAIALN
ncbi:hypothetical protein [Pseudanabaena mucicola]|nr:hypothetical protein [Pseudanabaena mucicola]